MSEKKPTLTFTWRGVRFERKDVVFPYRAVVGDVRLCVQCGDNGWVALEESQDARGCDAIDYDGELVAEADTPEEALDILALTARPQSREEWENKCSAARADCSTVGLPETISFAGTDLAVAVNGVYKGSDPGYYQVRVRRHKEGWMAILVLTGGDDDFELEAWGRDPAAAAQHLEEVFFNVFSSRIWLLAQNARDSAFQLGRLYPEQKEQMSIRVVRSDDEEIGQG